MNNDGKGGTEDQLLDDAAKQLLSKLGDRMPTEGQPIIVEDGDETPTINDDDLSEEQMAAKAEEEAKKRAEGKAKDEEEEEEDDDKKKSSNKEEITKLTAKAKADIDSLTDEEVDKLVKAGVLVDSNKEAADKQAKADKAKFDKISAKKEEELTEDDKKFVKEYKDKTEPKLIDKVKTALLDGEDDINLEATYENDDAGLTKLVTDVVAAKTKNTLLSIVKSSPEMEKLYNHFVVEKRGLGSFIKNNTQPEFKSFKIEKTSDANDKEKNEAIEKQQRGILEHMLTKRGNDSESIKVLLDSWQDGGKLYDKATEAYKTLEKEDKAEKQALLQQEEAQKAEIEADKKQVIDNVRATIQKNDFGGFKIPADKLNAFAKAVLEPINEEGLTRMDVLRRQRLTLERELLFDYLVYENFNVPGLSNNAKKRNHLTFSSEKKETKRQVRLAGAGDGGADVKPSFKIGDLDFANARMK